MSNRKNLKSAINNVCEALFAECVAANIYGNLNDEDTQTLLSSIVAINNEYIRRISHVQPGMKAKDYFRDVTEHFDKQVGEIIDQISNQG